MTKKNIKNIQEKKTVLVTGITGGIGRVIALRFAREGWDVVGQFCSSSDQAKVIEKQIKKMGARCSLVQADLLSEEQLQQLIKACSHFSIDCLVNNAGSYVEKKHFAELSVKNLTDTFMLNTIAPILLTSHIFEQMKKNGGGRIINISSIAAKYGGSAYSLHYGASKRALEGLTKTLAREGAGHNILINTVRPGMIDTNMHKLFPKNLEERIRLIPLKKMGRPQDIAEMVFYLGSEHNQYITNEIMTVAGGE